MQKQTFVCAFQAWKRGNMYQIGNYVVCGNNGPCRVEEIGTLDFSATKDKMYYTLVPEGNAGGRVFMPVDNEKISMRPVLTREEAEELVNEIAEIEPIWIPEEKSREMLYKEFLRSCDCRKLIQMIKTLYLRKLSREEQGKRVTAVDDKYFQLAETHLYAELAVSLGLERSEVGEYIHRNIEEKGFEEQAAFTV